MILHAPAHRLRIRSGRLHPRPSAVGEALSHAVRAATASPRFALLALILGIAVGAAATAVLA